MPDAPIATTRTLGLGQWGDKKNPGFLALNDNWKKIDDAILSSGPTNPTAYAVGGLFLNSTDQIIYQNTGTVDVPAWSAIFSVGTLAAQIATKANQSQVDTMQTELDGHDGRLTTIEGGYVKKDGSVAMTGDFDAGTKKVKNLANGIATTDGVNVQQMTAAIAAAVGSLAGVYAYILARNTTDITGSSPVVLACDQNDATTTKPTMHDVVTNNTRFYARQDGFYFFMARVKVTGAGGAGITWKLNGTEAPASVFPPFQHDVGEDTTFITDTILLPMSSGDYLECNVYGLLTEPMTVKADSTISGTLLVSNAVGGGDLKSDGTVPMAAEFDNGGFKAKNLADGTLATDAATKGQMAAADANLQAQITALGGMGVLQMPEVEVTGGSQTFGTSWVEWPASRLLFTLDSSTLVYLEAQGSFAPDFTGIQDSQIGLRIQKMVMGSPSGPPTDVKGQISVTPGRGYFVYVGLSVMKRITLAAGDWRVSIMMRRAGGTANAGSIYGTVEQPARIGASYMG